MTFYFAQLAHPERSSGGQISSNTERTQHRSSHQNYGQIGPWPKAYQHHAEAKPRADRDCHGKCKPDARVQHAGRRVKSSTARCCLALKSSALQAAKQQHVNQNSYRAGDREADRTAVLTQHYVQRQHREGDCCADERRNQSPPKCIEAATDQGLSAPAAEPEA